MLWLIRHLIENFQLNSEHILHDIKDLLCFFFLQLRQFGFVLYLDLGTVFLTVANFVILENYV